MLECIIFDLIIPWLFPFNIRFGWFERWINAIHQINRFPVDRLLCFLFDTYPLDSNLPGGGHYSPFKLRGPDNQRRTLVTDVPFLSVKAVNGSKYFVKV